MDTAPALIAVALIARIAWYVLKSIFILSKGRAGSDAGLRDVRMLLIYITRPRFPHSDLIHALTVNALAALSFIVAALKSSMILSIN